MYHFAVKGGLRGPAELAAMPPNRSTGSYQKRLDKVLGFDAATAEQYRLGVPGHSKYDLSRTVNNLCTIPAHEALFDEMGSDELAELEANFKPGEWPAVYREHPVTLEGAATNDFVIPVAMFCDGVPYTKTDSVIGWWCCNLLTGRRHLITLLRKRNQCRCGCRGWCSFYAIFTYLLWQFQALREEQVANLTPR